MLIVLLWPCMYYPLAGVSTPTAGHALCCAFAVATCSLHQTHSICCSLSWPGACTLPPVAQNPGTRRSQPAQLFGRPLPTGVQCTQQIPDVQLLIVLQGCLQVALIILMCPVLCCAAAVMCCSSNTAAHHCCRQYRNTRSMNGTARLALGPDRPAAGTSTSAWTASMHRRVI